MKFCLFFCILAFEACLANSRSINKDREKRSDDPSPAVQAVVEQLTQRLSQLEAQNSAMHTDFAQLRNDVGQLKTKRCETGTYNLSPHDKPQTYQPNGDVERRHIAHVTFSQPFASTPWVSVSLQKVDGESGHNLRVDSGSSNIGTTGFDVYILEWSDTHLYPSRVSWIACTL